MMTMQTELMPTSPVNGEKTFGFFFKHTFQSSITFEPHIYYKPYEKALPTEGIQIQAKTTHQTIEIYLAGRHFMTV